MYCPTEVNEENFSEREISFVERQSDHGIVLNIENKSGKRSFNITPFSTTPTTRTNFIVRDNDTKKILYYKRDHEDESENDNEINLPSDFDK